MRSRSCSKYKATDSAIPTVELSSRAAAEIKRARQWWIANRDKAPGAFDKELATLIQRLATNPRAVGIPQRNKPRRRVLLRRIRYHAYFRVLDDQDLVQILAFWHASRGKEPEI